MFGRAMVKYATKIFSSVVIPFIFIRVFIPDLDLIETIHIPVIHLFIINISSTFVNFIDVFESLFFILLYVELIF